MGELTSMRNIGREMARKLDEELGVPRLSPRQEQYGNDR